MFRYGLIHLDRHHSYSIAVYWIIFLTASVTVTTSDSNFTDPVHLGGGTDIPVHNTCVKKCSVLVYRLNEFTTGVTIDYM